VYHTNQALRELGHEVDEFWANDMPRRINHGNLHYLLELPFSYRRTVRKRCDGKRYDVIQLSQPYAWLSAKDHHRSDRPGVFVSRSHGLELIADTIVSRWHSRLGIPENRFPRSLLTNILRPLLHKQTYKVARFCDGMIVPSQDIADFLFERVKMPREKVAVVPHGVKDIYVKHPTAPMTLDRQSHILYVGQFSFIKGPHILAMSISEILKKHSQAKMTWVCSSAHHETVKSLLNPEISHRVKLHNWVSQDDLLTIYDSHGIFILTSFYEGAAKVCLEAMTRGLCVAATDIGAVRDYIQDGINGFRIKAGDVDGFVNAAGKLLVDIDLCRGMSDKAQLSALKYTWRRCAKEASQFYEKLLLEKRAIPSKI